MRASTTARSTGCGRSGPSIPTLSRAYLLVAVYADHGMFDQALAEEERWRPVVPAPVHWSAPGLHLRSRRPDRRGAARHPGAGAAERAGAGPGPRVRVELCRRAGHGADPGVAGEGVRGALGRAGERSRSARSTTFSGGIRGFSVCWSGWGSQDEAEGPPPPQLDNSLTARG